MSLSSSWWKSCRVIQKPEVGPMAEQTEPKIRIRPRILILFLLLGIPPLVIGHVVLINGARTTYTDVVANHFSEAADSAQTQLLNYVERISNEVGNLTRVSQILDVVVDSNRNRLEGNELDSQVEEREDDWLTQDPEDSRLQSGILNNEASRFVRKFNNITADFREILVTDAMGRLVAASNKTSDYFQADERWWQYAYQEGQGNSFYGDIQFDESANVYGMEIAYPIRDPASNQVIGVIKAIADAHEISAVVASTRLGPTSEAVLIASDGTGILGPERTVRYRFDEPVSLGDSGRRYVEATEVLALPAEERRVFLGLPQFRLKDRMPELDWILVVQEPYEEVFSPFRNLNRWFIYIAVFGVALVLVLALIFSRILSRPVIEVDPHLERI